MNIIQIAGHLGADAETRFTPSGQKVTTLRIATNSRRAGKDETIWWKATLWGDRFDKMLPYLKKGSGVIVVGEMSKPEIWTDREGKPQISLEITVEFVRFSPFGRPDKTGQEGVPNQAQGQSHFQGHQSPGHGAQSLAGGFAPGIASRGTQAQGEEEEDLPF